MAWGRFYHSMIFEASRPVCGFALPQTTALTSSLRCFRKLEAKQREEEREWVSERESLYELSQRAIYLARTKETSDMLIDVCLCVSSLPSPRHPAASAAALWRQFRWWTTVFLSFGRAENRLDDLAFVCRVAHDEEEKASDDTSACDSPQHPKPRLAKWKCHVKILWRWRNELSRIKWWRSSLSARLITTIAIVLSKSCFIFVDHIEHAVLDEVKSRRTELCSTKVVDFSLLYYYFAASVDFSQSPVYLVRK